MNNAPTAPVSSLIAFYLLDTNILLRLTETSSATHATTLQAVSALLADGAVVFITGQNLIEFWNVATRPLEKNGLGLTTAEVSAELARHKAAFRLLPDSPAILAQWETLVVRYDVQGQKVHDARLAAVALSYQVSHLLTFNDRDFKRLAPAGLQIIDPAGVALGSERTPES